MTRRMTIAIAAVAALGVSVPTAGAAAKRNEIRITGGPEFKAGKYVKDAVRFNANTKVRSGGTIKVVNKSPEAGPHTISLVERGALPRTLAQAEACFEFQGVCEPLVAAHQFNPETEEPGVPLYNAGAEGFDTMGDLTTAGDSIFFAPGQPVSFDVTADKGSKLFYFCAVHPWMQGKIRVT